MSVEPISNQTARWQQLDAEHHVHPFTDHAALKDIGARVITRAEGVYIYDSTGQKLLDGFSGLWCCQLGYGNMDLANAGYEALKNMAYYNTFFQTTHPAVVELSEKLTEITPEGIDTFHFASSGSEANDTAVKFIRYYWNLQGKKNKKVILAREFGYHGSTMVGSSLTGLKFMHPQFDLPLPGFEHVGPPPHWYKFGGDLSPDEFGLKVVEETEKAIQRIGPDNVAAFIGEPIMGAGGLIIPPETYWPAIQELCRKHDILIWADEVITGFGRTGNWFGSQTLGIEPDIITMAKGLTSGYQPMSAIGMGQKIGQAVKTANEEFAHGFTYSGHPVCAAVALKNLELLDELNVQGEAMQSKMAYFQDRIQTLSDHPLVGEVRGIGFLGAVELVKDKATKTYYPSELDVGYICREHCFQNGLVMRATGDTMMMCPPLIITESEIDEFVDKSRLCFDLTLKSIES